MATPTKESMMVNRLRKAFEKESQELDQLNIKRREIDEAIKLRQVVFERLQSIVKSNGNGSNGNGSKRGPYKKKSKQTYQELAIEVLTEAGTAMRCAEIVKRVVQMSNKPMKSAAEGVPQALLAGMRKTPAIFRRVDTGIYALAK